MQVRNEKVQLERVLEQEHIQARTDMITRVSSLAAQKKNLTLAQSIYRVSKEKYTQGLSSNLEVLTAATTLKEVETQYYNALYEAIIAKIALEKAEGTIYPTQ